MGTCMIVCANGHSTDRQRAQAYISTEQSTKIQQELMTEPGIQKQGLPIKEEEILLQAKEITRNHLRKGTPVSIKSRFFREKNDLQSDASVYGTQQTTQHLPPPLELRHAPRKTNSKGHKKQQQGLKKQKQGLKKQQLREKKRLNKGGFDRNVKIANIFQSLQKEAKDCNPSERIILRKKKMLVLPNEIEDASNPSPSDSSQSMEFSQKIPNIANNILTINYKDGSTYSGEMKQDKRNGMGVIRWKDGSIYQGEWKDNCLNGQGKLVYADKDQYIGQFKNNKAEGKGEFYSLAQGFTYEGQWKDSLPDGKGTEMFRNGQKYQGEWSSGMKNGFGQLVFEDGASFYRGDFVKNELHGHGEYFWAGKSRYDGQWQHNQKCGYGILWWQNGQRYEGQFLHDKMHGNGIFFSTDGSSFKGNWECGRREGVFIETTSSGQVRHSIWHFNNLLNYVDADAVQERGQEPLPPNLKCRA